MNNQSNFDKYSHQTIGGHPDILNNQEDFLIAQALTRQTILTNQTPDNANASDDNTAYELGMKFRSSRTGRVTAIRYYKSPSEAGVHIGKIWAVTGGSPLATVTFSNETASGWQEASLSSPLNIQPNTTYVVSVNCNTHFPITYDQMQNSIVNGDVSSVADSNNGVFDSAGNFPSNSYRNSNYFRDVVFIAENTSTITKVGGDNQTGTTGTTLSNPLVVQINDSSGNPQPGVTVNFTVTSGGGSVSPASAVTNANGQASTILTLGALPGATNPITNTVNATVSGIGGVTFTATSNPVVLNNNLTVLTTQNPDIADASDGTAYELGMKFMSTTAGKITAIKFLKPPSETGTHIGKIWDATTGIALATVIFTSESASGWQQQALVNPLVIQANKVYVVSVNCNSNFAIGYNHFVSSIVNGDLRSVADGNNGVFGSPNSFPTGSYNNSNYFRDIVFSSGSTLIKWSGDNQSGTVGTTLPDNLVVQVNDVSGNPQSGVTVNFAITNGGGSVSPTSAVTNANGQASTTLTLGSIPSGANNGTLVTATVSGIGSVYFNATAVPADSNPIVTENQKPGTTNWKITNQAGNEISGYATATSVNKGGSLGIKVSVATQGALFTIDIYRLGYYGGTGGRLVTSSGSLNGITQPAFTITDPNTRLGEANWSTSYTVNVGSNWTSGLYIAKLTDQTTGKQSQVWFVVRDDNSNADILFQSSFTTYLAYSSSSGYSLYGFNSFGGQRAFKVSYDLPLSQTTTQTGEFNNLLRWEYNMVRWLESQGYNVSYVTNMDVHSNPALLQQHKIFMSVGHDEYWSMEACNHVEQARDHTNPTNLAFFSANTCYWRVRFENSSTGQANRVMACYKQDWALDPVAPTNKFRNPENNKPENALLGVMYTGDRDVVYGGYDFVVTNSSDPYYAHTGLQDGDQLPLLVGFEWDAVINNGSSPNGLVVLSESPVDPQNIDTDVPQGTDYQISHAVRYTAASGAKVFATGSIHWMWGLDSDGVQTPREDIRAKQIAVNVLKDMGAIPQTPEAGIIIS